MRKTFKLEPPPRKRPPLQSNLYWTFKRAAALFGRAFALLTEYRAEMFVWIVSGSLPLIMMLIWIGLAEDGPVGGYTAPDFAAYFLTVFLVRQATVVWVLWDLDREIRLGELSPKLLRPLDPYWEHVVGNLAEKTLRVPVVLVPVALGLWWAGARLDLSPVNLLIFMFTLAGAWAIRFNQQYSFGLLTFWFDQVLGLEQTYFALYIGLSGALIPLELFPDAVRAAIAYTPFPYMIDFPVQVLLGKVAGAELWRGVAAQGVWVLAFAGLRLLLWRQGLKRYGAVGA